MNERTQEETESLRDTVRFYLIDHETLPGKVIDVALLLLNLAFVAIFVIETYPHSDATGDLLWILEVGLVAVFIMEYAARLYGSRDRLNLVKDPYSVADLVAILPTIFLAVLPGLGVAAYISVLRILRVLRVLRFFRFTATPDFFFGTVSTYILKVMRLFLTVLIIFFMSSGLFYHVENAANPGVENFGDAFYYTVVAITTVGFGDIVPVTETGRWVTVSAIIAGIILIPWQVSKIVREWSHKGKVDVTCPECGLQYHDPDAVHCKACGATIYQEYESSGNEYLR